MEHSITIRFEEEMFLQGNINALDCTLRLMQIFKGANSSDIIFIDSIHGDKFRITIKNDYITAHTYR